MLFLPREILEEGANLMQTGTGGDVGPRMRRVVELHPGLGVPGLGLATTLDATTWREEMLWKALHLAPCGVHPYVTLAEALTKKNEADATAKRLRLLGLWKLSFADEIPAYLGQFFEPSLGPEAWEPESYEIMATAEQT